MDIVRANHYDIFYWIFVHHKQTYQEDRYYRTHSGINIGVPFIAHFVCYRRDFLYIENKHK